MRAFQSDWLFDEHVLARLEQVAAQFEMRVRGSDNYRGIDDRKERMRVGRTMTLRNTRRIQPFRIALGDKKLDRHRLQDAEMIHAPAPEPDEKNSFRLLHLLPPISKVRHLARSISWQQ